MGHLGKWLEIRRWRPKNQEENDNPIRMTMNHGLTQTSFFNIPGNKMLVTHEPSVAAASQLKLPTP